jgi:hypothetical protein
MGAKDVRQNPKGHVEFAEKGLDRVATIVIIRHPSILVAR